MADHPAEAAAEFVRRYWSTDDSAPKHARLVRALSSAIEQGYWLPGARLPTETELTAATPCSLGTVQRALRRLADDGVIQRRRGCGTIVSDLDRAMVQPWHMRFLDDDDPAGEPLPVFTKTLSRRIVTDRGRWSRPLDQRKRRVVRIDRIFAIAGKVKVYAIMHALADRFPALTTSPLSELDGANFKTLIAQHHVMPVHRVRQSLRFERPPAAIIEASGLKSGVAVTVVNFVAYALGGDAMYHQDFYVPPSRFRLDLGISLNAGN